MSTYLSEHIRVELDGIRAVVGDVRALLAEGWVATDGLTSGRLVRADLSDPTPYLARLEALGAAVLDVHVVGMRAGQALRLRRVNHRYEVVSLPEASPEALFEDRDEQELATRAWDRDGDAALSLPLSWTITIDLNLTRLVAVPAGIELRVCLYAKTITDAISSATPTSAGLLMPRPGNRRVYLAALDPGDTVNLGAITLSCLPVDTDPGTGALDLPGSGEPMAGELAVFDALPAELPPAFQLLPPSEPPPAQWQASVTRLGSLSAFSVWCSLASSCSVEPAGVHLEFVGFKRLALDLPDPDQNDADAVAQTHRLRTWSFRDESPDRLLAVRQVVSLYTGHDALAHADDILASAEIIYLGLRSDAVAEVVKSAREAQSQVLDAVRQGLRSAQDLAKSATERFFAALVGIGAVLIANASKSLSDHVSRDLMLLVAGFLVALALFSILVEGPLLAIPLRNLERDLKDGSSLLTADQLQRATSIPSVGSTRRRLTAIRVVIPTFYALTAALILVLGYPNQYK